MSNLNRPEAGHIIAQSHDAAKMAGHHLKQSPTTFGYAGRYATIPAPAHSIAEHGTNPEAAYRLIHDELALDGSTILNMASFVQTWMPPQADALMHENMSKNLIDADEYPATQVIHERCVSMIADLWHNENPKEAVGTATTGSSEAIQLGGLAMKKNWQERMKKSGKNIHEPGPNIVMGANAQVALEKFARYFDVEMRLVPVSKKTRYCLDPKEAMKYIDENTIGVFVIMGSTYTGHYESVKGMADALDDYERRTGVHVPIHVDAASGGFIAPFVTAYQPNLIDAQPDLLWDFRIPRVVSINASGHKYGLSYVGVGWIVFRTPHHLPSDMVFELRYLGSVQYSFSLNFSRPAAPIIAQYFSLVYLGKEGYRRVCGDDLANARLLSRALEEMGSDQEGMQGMGWWDVVSGIHRARGVYEGKGINSASVDDYEPGLPVVAFKFSAQFQKQNPNVKQRFVHVMLRAKGWIIPNYALPPNVDDEEILRVVIKENTSENLLDQLIADIIEVVDELIKETPHEQTFKMLDVAHNRGGRRARAQQIAKLEAISAFKGKGHSGTYNHPC